MPAYSWKSLSNMMGANLWHAGCVQHQSLDPDCPECQDVAAVRTYRAAKARDKVKALTASEWRDVAFTLAGRQRNHAEQCVVHTRITADCPFCDDTKAWRAFEKKALAEGLPLPGQRFYDAMAAAEVVNIRDLVDESSLVILDRLDPSGDGGVD